MKYEYQLLQIPVLGQDSEIDTLNSYGDDGWVVVDVEHDYREGQRRYLLMREALPAWTQPPTEMETIDLSIPRRPAWARG